MIVQEFIGMKSILFLNIIAYIFNIKFLFCYVTEKYKNIYLVSFTDHKIFWMRFYMCHILSLVESFHLIYFNT